MQKTEAIIHVGKGSKKTDLTGRVMEAMSNKHIVVESDSNSYKLNYNEGADVYDAKVFGKYIWCAFSFSKSFVVNKVKRPAVGEKPAKARTSKSGLPRKFK